MRFPWIVLLCCLVGAASAADYPPLTVEVKARQVSEHVYYAPGMPGMATEFNGFISNAAFVVTDEGVVVFDALGSPSLAWELRQRIREITDQPVVKVVVSHYHADHIYGLQVFQDEGAEIIAPVGALEYLDSPAAAERLEERRFSLDPWVNDDTRLVRPDRLIDRTHRFELGGVSFRLDYLGKAHADGDLSMFVEPDAVLLAGDIIFEGRIPWVGDADTRRWLEALEMMEQADVKALIPGHGPAAKHPKQALAQTREYVAYLREVMGEAVDQMQDFASAYAAADWSAYRKMPAFEAANRRNAYQVYLAMERESMGQ